MVDDNLIRVFIGYDSKETVAYHVLAHSIMEHSSRPVSIIPINLKNLGDLFTRERNNLQSTEFSFSRFLTPYLSNYKGWSIFMDCDMLAFDDISKLGALADEKFAVMCVKHDYVPKDDKKFLGNVQTKYEKKNWSSMMLFNNEKCTALTPDYVNTATGLELHQFKWLDGDQLIGGLPARWNFLAGEYEKIADPGLVHYTVGGPYFREYESCDYAAEWFAARDRMNFVEQRT